MATLNFGTLQSAINALIARDDIPQVVYDMATSEINTRFDLRIMQSTSTLSATGESVSLPSDFLVAVEAYVDRDPRIPLDYVTEWSKDLRYKTSGVPKEWTIIDGAILLNPAPDSTYSIKLRYIASLSEFASDSDQNDVLTTYVPIWIYCVLKHHALTISDVEEAQTWGAAFEHFARLVEKKDIRVKSGPGPLQMRAAYQP